MERHLVCFFRGECIEGEWRVKIVCTGKNLHERKKGLQTGCSSPIKLLGIIQCKDKSAMLNLKTSLHKQFEEHKIMGEWFRLTPELSAYIQLCESGAGILEDDYKRYKKREKERKRERYHNDPEVKDRERKRGREYRQRPEVKDRERKRGREYRQRPEVRKSERERQRELYKNPEFRECKKERSRERYARKKQENQ